MWGMRGMRGSILETSAILEQELQAGQYNFHSGAMDLTCRGVCNKITGLVSVRVIHI